MRKPVAIFLIVLFMLTFTVTATYTVTSAKPPFKCNTCKKDGCPEGYCYVDCVGCCFEHPLYGIVCFR